MLFNPGWALIFLNYNSINFINHFLLVFYYSCPNFPPLPSSTHPISTPTVNPHPIVHIHGSFIRVLEIVPSPSFRSYLPPTSPLQTVSLFYVSMPVVLFCSLDSSFIQAFAHTVHDGPPTCA